MPGSSSILDSEIVSILKRINPVTTFDVGVGAGKYGKLITQLFPSSKIDGCEIDLNYFTEFKDAYNNYNNVINKSIIDIIDTEEFERDLVIFGDVLEHLKNSQIIDVLDYFQYRSRYMLCLYPTRLRQGIWFGHKSERHMSEVRINDIINKFDVWEFKKVQDTSFLMNLLLIKGYL